MGEEKECHQFCFLIILWRMLMIILISFFLFSTRTQYSYKIKIKDSKPISNYLCPNGYSSLQPQLHDYETMIMKTTIEKGIRK